MPSSSLFLRAGIVLSALSSTALATSYDLQDTFKGSSFLDGFDFYTAPDLTKGFVTYVDKNTAKNDGLIKMIGEDQYIGVDYQTPLVVGDNLPLRKSVRIETKTSYNQGLFIVDIKHMPGGICGTWPAFWSLGSGDWPKNGEIDIIEGVNMNSANKWVLHTDTQCSVDGKNQTGAQSLYNCALDSASGPSGCDVNAVEANTFGTGFNANGGGVYAMEWTDDFIKMWFFPRGYTPSSIQHDKPDTAEFGVPNANFQGACDMKKKFVDHKFIFNTAFCGDWAGGVYGQSGCPVYSGLDGWASCNKFVAENPSAFKNAYWQISSFKSYKKAAISSSSSSSMSSTQSSTSSSAMSSTVSSSSYGASSTLSSSYSVSSSSSIASSNATSSASSTGPYYPTGNSSTIIYPTGTGYPSGGSSTIVYPTSSTPCTTSSVDSYGTSSSDIYGEYPTTTPGGYGSASTTTYTTTYVDVCETGYTTISTTHTATYYPTPKPSTTASGEKECPPGFTTTVKYCSKGCGSKPTVVTVTVPVTETVKCPSCSKTPAPYPVTEIEYITKTVVCKTCHGGTSKYTYPAHIYTTPSMPYPSGGPGCSGPECPESYPTGKPGCSGPECPESYPTGKPGCSGPECPESYPTGKPGCSGPECPESYPTGKPGCSGPECPESYPTGCSGPSCPSYISTTILTLAYSSQPACSTCGVPAPSSPPVCSGPECPETYPTGKPGCSGAGCGYEYGNGNMTVSFGTATGSYPTKTGYEVPQFTGAASSLRISGMLAGAVGLVAMFL
ncbi:hypothetical protein CC78DRAFT_537052 [Lojkania enalia]|uniref:endo-1,3(4)-beta-glucanase n=1 Tax=Lojkania enalia TaxID=147567 RepID=A0A9P4K2C6_9PLEO|nr:hypothetical protein CC78DRAFT_537052 [Didymosphaeria enalia]